MSRRPPASGVAPETGCRRCRPCRRRDERGGAVSLLVILTVPALALAAVTAAAAPQRLAAQAALDDTATQLAAMAAHWRQAQNRPHGPLDWYYPECAPHPANAQASRPGVTADEAETARSVRDGPTDSPGPTDPDRPPESQPELRELCEAAARSLLAGLGAAGIDADQLAGYHTSSLAAADAPDHLTSALPCRSSARTVTADAVHLAATAPWATRSWAPGRVWHGGVTLHADATARITRAAAADGAGHYPDCGPLAGERIRQLADLSPASTAFGNARTP